MMHILCFYKNKKAVSTQTHVNTAFTIIICVQTPHISSAYCLFCLLLYIAYNMRIKVIEIFAILTYD